MTTFFYKTTELKDASYIKNPWRSSVILNIGNNDKNCFLCSIFAYLHPCNINHPNRVSKYRQNFDELNIEGFDFTNGFKCNDVLKFEKLSVYL